ncbi:MAG: hypothetical protein H6R02_2585 [Burkholderiaceae bacterium]|nr:hypothetical protein [Burkholderiaceae bacterium]
MFNLTGPAPPRVRPWLLIVSCTMLSACATFPLPGELRATAAPYPGGPPPAELDGRARYRQIYCDLVGRQTGAAPATTNCDDLIWRLLDEAAPAGNPAELPVLAARLRIFVVSGAFSDCRAPATVPFEEAIARLTAQGTRIAPILVSGRSGAAHNAQQIADALRSVELEPGEQVVLVGYSKGTVDILEFLAAFPQDAQPVVAVVSVAGAVQGSPLADDGDWWYRTFVAHAFPGTCDPGDGQVLHSLRPATRRAWFESHALPERIAYFSLAAFTTEEHLSHGLKPTWRSLARHDKRNDGQVLASDAIIPGSTLLGYVNADHWDIAISLEDQMPQFSRRDSARALPRSELLLAALLYVSESLAPSGAVSTSAGRGAAAQPPRTGAAAKSNPRTAGTARFIRCINTICADSTQCDAHPEGGSPDATVRRESAIERAVQHPVPVRCCTGPWPLARPWGGRQAGISALLQ